MIRRLPLWLASLLLLAVPCLGRPGPNSNYNVAVPGGGGGYTGIGDLSVPGTVIGYWGGDCYKKTGTYDIFQVYDTTSSAVTATVECVNGAYAVTGGSTWSLAQVKSNCLTTECLAYYVYDQSASDLCSSVTCDVSPYPSQTTNAPYLVYANGTTCDGANAGLFCFNSATTSANLETVNATAAYAQPLNTTCVGASNNVNNNDIFGTTSFDIRLNNSNGTPYVYAGTYIGPGTLTANTWFAMFATFNNAGSGLTAPVSQLNNLTPSNTSQGSNTIASADKIAVGNGFNGGVIGACFATETSVFGSSAIASMYSTWKAHWGGGMP